MNWPLRNAGLAVVSRLAMKLARELKRRIVLPRLEVDDALEQPEGLRLAWLGDPDLAL